MITPLFTSASTPPDFDHWCFISYRHLDNREEHRQWASWLHQEIEHYEVPAELVGTLNDSGELIKARIYPVFRDEDSLAADSHLGEEILEALRGSRTMLVICSPRSSISDYVEGEITYFQSLGRADRIITAIIDGEPNNPSKECFPAPLRLIAKEGTSINVNDGPLAADFRLADGTQGFTSVEGYRLTLINSDSPRKVMKLLVENYEARMQLMKLKILAGILDVKLEKLRDRDKAYQLGLAKQRANTLKKWLTSVAILALLAIASAIIAYRLKIAAIRNFQAARSVADGLVTEITKNLADVQGVRADAVRKILASTEATYDRLLQSSPDNPEIIKGKAAMYNEFVTTYLKTGDTESLMKSAEESLKLNKKLVIRSPDDESLTRALGMSFMKVGDALLEVGKLDEAEKSYNRSLELRNEIGIKHPDDLDIQREIGISLLRLSDIDEARHDISSTAAHVKASVEIRRAIAKKNLKMNATLLVGLVRLHDVKLLQDDAVGAEDVSKEVENLANSLVLEDPNNDRRARVLAIAKQRVGNALFAKRDFGAAERYYRESLTLFTSLSERDVTNIELKEDHAIALQRLGLVAKAMGNINHARDQFKASTELGETVIKNSSNNRQWNIDLAETYLEWGRIETGEARNHAFAAARKILIGLKDSHSAEKPQLQWLDEIEASLVGKSHN